MNFPDQEICVLMGEGFMGGVHPPFTIFFDFRLRSLRYEKDFLPVLSKLSQTYMVNIFKVLKYYAFGKLVILHPPFSLQMINAFHIFITFLNPSKY